MRMGDTIAALSSGQVPSGVAVIRLSGPDVSQLLMEICGGVPEPRRLSLMRIGAETVLDRGLAAFFPAPASFTGEDCAELQVHGSLAGVKAILRLLVDKGARLAEAGEFTRRAFENGKLDLTEIEGLGDLLEAETENQRRQALARLEGGLSQRIDGWRDSILNLRAQIEANLDFSDEGDVGEQLPPSFGHALSALHADIVQALTSLEGGRIVREGLRVALAGAPNAGKSSLLNSLAKSDIAIVTEEAGTTRDVREVPIDLGGQLVVVLDLAGLRDTRSKAEAEGVRRAREEIGRADLVLWLEAPDTERAMMPPVDVPVWRIATKTDLAPASRDANFGISTKDNIGIGELVGALGQFAQAQIGSGEPSLLSRERDRVALTEANNLIERASARLEQPEIAAELLRAASQALERLVGRIDAEKVLDRLFLRFCIGK